MRNRHTGPGEVEMRFALMASLVTTLTAFGAVEAQTPLAPRVFLDFTLVGAQPTGEFGLNVDDGWGAELGGRYALDPRGLLSIRASLGFIQYGNETLRFCSFYGCRVGVDLDTENNIVYFGVGPEFGIQVGPLRPYARAALGVGYFETKSGLRGDDSHYTYASTNNFDDVVFQKQVGAGLEVRVSNGRNPVWLDFGADYHHNGVANYLREGDIVDQPDGSILIFPRRTEANLWSFRLGVSIGLGRDG